MKHIQDITQHPSKHIIEHRLKVIMFYDDYGADATRRAFSVSRSTVFLWKQTLTNAQGRITALAPSSRAPNRRRSRQTDQRVTEFIVQQRTLHPRLSKDKLAVLLHAPCHRWNLPPPSASTVGRILGDLKHQGRLPTYARLAVDARTGRLHQKRKPATRTRRRRGDYQPTQPGDMLQIDTIVKFIHGIRRYVLTAVDYHGRFAFAYGYTSPSSANAADFLSKLQAVAPFTVQRVHHDNGSEFLKHFIRACEQQGVIQFWNYPGKPQHNGMVERFNRTIQDEFIDSQLDDLAYDLPCFNRSLMDWLVWYNTKRPHYSLGLKSPMQYLLDLLQLPTTESNMLWTDTNA